MSDDETVYRYSDDDFYDEASYTYEEEMEIESDEEDGRFHDSVSNDHDRLSSPLSPSPSESKRLKNTIDGDLNLAVKLELENAFSEAEALLDFRSNPEKFKCAVMRNNEIDAAIGAFEQIITREMTEMHGKVGPFHTKAINKILYLELSRGEVQRAKTKYFQFLNSLASATSFASLSPPSSSSLDRNRNNAGDMQTQSCSYYTHTNTKPPSLKEAQEMQDEIEDMLYHFCNVIRSNLNLGSVSIEASTSSDSGSGSNSDSDKNGSNVNFDPHQLLKEIFETTRNLFHPSRGARPSEKLWFKINLKYGRVLCETREVDDFLTPSPPPHLGPTSETATGTKNNVDGDAGDGTNADQNDSGNSNDNDASGMSTSTYDQVREVITDLISSTSRQTCWDENDANKAMKLIRTFNVMPGSLDDLMAGLLRTDEEESSSSLLYTPSKPAMKLLGENSEESPKKMGRYTYKNTRVETPAPAPSNTRSYIQLHRAQVYAMDLYISTARKEHHDMLREKYALVQGEVDRGCILDPKSRVFMERMRPILYAGHDMLSEDLWVRIMQYCCTSNFNSLLKYDLQKMAMVSKDFLRLSTMCIKSIPINLEDVSYQSVAWACQAKVKIGRLDCNYLVPSGLLHILNCCSIRDISSLSLVVTLPKYSMPTREQIWEDVERLAREGAEVGIPNDTFDYSGNLREDWENLHRQVEQKIREKSRGTPIELKELTINIYKEGWYEPLLDLFSHTIEVLRLTIDTLAENRQTVVFNFDEDLQRISRMIEGMKNLKKIHITANFSAHFHIRSQSLRQICTQTSKLDFRVDECRCPSLELFKCVHRIRPVGQMYNGVAPITPFLVREIRVLQHVHHLHEIEDAIGDMIPMPHNPNHIANPIILARLPPPIRGEFLGRTHAEFQVSSRPFRGMEVPGTCIVCITESSLAMERLLDQLNEEV